MGKVFGILATIGTLVVVGITATVAAAASLHPPHVGSNCGSATGDWHFVHNQTDATSGTLTVTFSNPASVHVVQNGPPFQSNNLHYYVNDVAGTLVSAVDGAAG